MSRNTSANRADPSGAVSTAVLRTVFWNNFRRYLGQFAVYWEGGQRAFNLELASNEMTAAQLADPRVAALFTNIRIPAGSAARFVSGRGAATGGDHIISLLNAGFSEQEILELPLYYENTGARIAGWRYYPSTNPNPGWSNKTGPDWWAGFTYAGWWLQHAPQIGGHVLKGVMLGVEGGLATYQVFKHNGDKTGVSRHEAKTAAIWMGVISAGTGVAADLIFLNFAVPKLFNASGGVANMTTWGKYSQALIIGVFSVYGPTTIVQGVAKAFIYWSMVDKKNIGISGGKFAREQFVGEMLDVLYVMATAQIPYGSRLLIKVNTTLIPRMFDASGAVIPLLGGNLSRKFASRAIADAIWVGFRYLWDGVAQRHWYRTSV